jgi:protein-tyrosine-phosphatase
MAEGILKNILSNYDVSSAGIITANGLMPSENAVLATEEIGIDISNHKSRLISNKLFEESDIILCMTQDHKEMIMTYLGENEKTFTLAEFAGENSDMPDPFGGDLAEYILCRDSIATLLEKVAQRLKCENDD